MDDSKLLHLRHLNLNKFAMSQPLNHEEMRPNSAKTNLVMGLLNNHKDPMLNDDSEMRETDMKYLAKSISLPILNNPSRSIKAMYAKQKKQSIIKSSKLAPITAWPEENIASIISEKVKPYRPINLLTAKKTPSVSRIIDKNIAIESDLKLPKGLISMQQHLKVQQDSTRKDENFTRLIMMQDADTMVNELPLTYLYSKPGLRQYAYEKACRPIIKLALLRAYEEMKHAFQKWKLPPPVVKMNEIQIGFMVIGERLIHLLHTVLSKKFKIWALLHASRYAAIKYQRYAYFVIQIQRWYRHMTIIKKEPWKMLEHAIQTCLHRRRAIKYMLQLEFSRRQAAIKIRRGIATRRRFHFAARAIQRVFRWVLLYRRIRWRLTRITAARKIQSWRKMLLCRDATDWLLIHLILRSGGYSIVHRKVPKKHAKAWSFLYSVNACISQLQKAWFVSRGNFSLFIKAQARKAKMAHEKLLNDMATLIQSNYRAHLWYLLTLAAFQNNRARRIQRGFRSYQYRCWNLRIIQIRRHRLTQRIQRAYRTHRWLLFLRNRFKSRKYLIVFLRAKKQLSAIYIQRCYRAKKVYELKKKEEMRQFFALQRLQALQVLKTISKIQRNWRQLKNPAKFPRHVYLVMKRLYLEKRRKLNTNALIIQKRVKIFIEKIAAEMLKLKNMSAEVIARVTKKYLLRLAIFDRVRATIERRNRASNVIKRNLRGGLWWRLMSIRFSLMRARIDYKILIQQSANSIQRILHGKYMEYHAAVRVAGRRQLWKRRKREEEDRIWKINDKASRKIQKLFKGIKKWNFALRKVAKYRKLFIERRSAKSIQKLFRSIRCWARYRRVIAAKYARIEAERIAKIHTKASNTIGFFWRRHKELQALSLRFVLRRKMLDVYYDLKAKREKAEADRLDALDDVRKTNENLNTTIAASWKQGSDTQGRNYYYNYVTGESQWLPPENWVMKTLDVYIRSIDERMNVYYYNQQTGDSRWLPPCVICALESSKWCVDCGVAYCDDHFDNTHSIEADETMQDHTWSAVEYEKEKLSPGDIYCVECKRRTAKRMCTTCWDAYCDDCFKFVHHIGALKFHKTIPYRKAKKGWICVKGRVSGEQDYYINGTTGETTFDKPEELMSPQERIYFENFKSHQKQAEDHVKSIEQLQIDLEATKYERDSILYEALNGNKNVASLLRKKPKEKLGIDETGSDVLAATISNAKQSGGGGIMSIFTGDKAGAYRQNILRPTERVRGKARSDYIKSLLDEDDKKK